MTRPPRWLVRAALPIVATGAAFLARAAWRAGLGAYDKWLAEKERQAKETPETDDDERAAAARGAIDAVKDFTEKQE